MCGHEYVVSLGHLSPSMVICMPRDPKRTGQMPVPRHTCQTDVPTVPSDQSWDHKIVDHVIVSYSRYVVTYRRKA